MNGTYGWKLFMPSIATSYACETCCLDFEVDKYHQEKVPLAYHELRYNPIDLLPRPIVLGSTHG